MWSNMVGDVIMSDDRFSGHLPIMLRRIADELDGCEPNSYWECWMMLINQMNQGNPAWNKDMTGMSSFDAAKRELQRLYAIDKTVRQLSPRDDM